MIPRKRILRFWTDAHDGLSEEQQDKFLAHPGLQFMSEYNEQLVENTIKFEKRLSEVVRLITEEIRPISHFEHPTSLPIYNETRDRHNTLRCPDCKQLLVLKENNENSDTFWGCTNWRMNAARGHCRIGIPANSSN